MRLLAMLVLAGAVFSGGCATACPAALLVGVLTEQVGELVVIPEGGVRATQVNWPSGYGLRRDGGVLVVTDLFGTIVARDGDTVRLGGGETSQDDKSWTACGILEVQ